MRCPVCKQDKVMLMHSQNDDPIALVPHPQPLYQISYPGEREYVSPRCEDCFNKLMERRSKKCQRKA
jgi:hypothetical protein